LPGYQGHDQLLALLADADIGVRKAAAIAAGTLREKAAASELSKLATDPDPDVRVASFESLRQLRDERAIPAATLALADSRVSLVAVSYLGEVGGPKLAPKIVEFAKTNLAAENLLAA